MNRGQSRTLALLLFGLLAAGRVRGDQIAAADLQIQGVGLKVVTVSATTGLNIPAAIQTEFGGKQNDQAPVVEGLLAVGELSGPGIDAPIRLETAPGHQFPIPGLTREGIYFLQNIRLMKGADFLQPATPSVATITVSNLLQTSVRVRQLTAEELRARGISVDARNYDVYEYTFSFLVDGQIVEIPFPVIVDPRTHEVRPVPEIVPWVLPPVEQVLPPRWFPPEILTFEMAPPPEMQPNYGDAPSGGGGGGRISIPAALVIPNNLAVLHQFFAVTLMVTNGAPAGATVTLDDISAQIKPPAPLRTVKSSPAVAFNQPVPIVDATTGVTFLVAQARGEAEWTMEGLQPGTHTIEVEVQATYKSPGQIDFPLRGTARASVVVHDPRFNINFSHPDTVRKDIEYSTYSFITNMSGALQNIRVSSGLPSCNESPGANVCRVDGTPEFHDLTIPAGEMRSIEYKLRPGITGHVFATAGSVSDEAITAAVQLHMGVSESGIPLSPATLVMPYYAQFVSQPMVSANLQLLGLGYSLATAPLTPALAGHPRVIKTDVFQRATDIARAGQRVFLGETMAASLAHMTLDLLGNTTELREWDDLRRAEKTGRTGAASIARELETSLGGGSLDDFVSRFATDTAWRAPYLLALTSAGALSVRDVTSNARLDVASEAESGWVRQLPFGELNRFQSGELAVIGRWAGDYEVSVTPAVDGPFTLDVILPASAQGSVLRARFALTGSAGKALEVRIARGATTLEVRDSAGAFVAGADTHAVAPKPLTVVGARQDLNLDPSGHKVSILWSRPVQIAAGDDLLAKLSAQINLNTDGVQYQGPRPMSSAALQEGGRVANVTFDHALSRNASYSMTVGPLVDPIGGASVSFPDAIVPVIDNASPGGILFGHVLKGDNSPFPDAEVRLFLQGNAGPPQYDLSRAGDAAFLFEFVPRDIDNDLPGTYKLEAVAPDLKTTSLDGAVRLPGRVHLVNLVFLGRGSAEGFVRYDNGEIVPGADVVIGSTMFDQFRSTKTDANGHYSVGDLPVGPLTFSAKDEDGNVTFAASEIKTPGQAIVQDLSIYRRPFPGTGTIRGIVRRSDTNAAVAFAQIGVYSQGYGLSDGFTDAGGRFEFKRVPIGFVTVLAAEWTLSRRSTAIDFDLAANEIRDVTLTLEVQPAEALAVVEGDVTREDPLFPGDTSKYQKVPGALVKIEKGQTVTADGNGHFIFSSVGTSFSGKKIEAYDPITTRTGFAFLPQLDPSAVNRAPIFILTANGYGEGTIRVRLLDAAGYPATGLRVIVPGFPPEGPTTLAGKPNGVYLLEHVPVGGTRTIWAIGGGGTYGDQTATGSAKVEFNGHVAALNLRLPGQGTVRTKLTADIDVIGDVDITYRAWDEALQNLWPKKLTRSTSENGLAGYANFTAIPALQDFTVSSAHPVYGYASKTGKVGFDGDVQSLTLQLNKLSTVSGIVYAIDGRTPVPGAAVRIEDGRQNPGIQLTTPDGSFEFRNVAAGVSFRVIAEITQDGTYRTGVAAGFTPVLGGPVNGVLVVLREQGTINGRIVYSGYRVFDPQNPANNVVDTTPGDLTDNAPVPLASFVLRELDFPYRSFGTTAEPQKADVAGRFTANNVFSGPLRVTAFDPGNQEVRGTWTGTITEEGEEVTAIIGIGAEGFGPVIVHVLDPNAQNAPVLNAEVKLIKAVYPYAIFDLSTTDAGGTVRFEQVPVGSYKVAAYSKALGKSGGSAAFDVANITGWQTDVVLEFSGKVDGKLTDPDRGGQGVPGTPVTLTEQSFQTRTSTDTGGLFVFDGVREGLFRLDAKDTLSNRRASASHLLSQADPNPFVALELEPTETLYLSVYLPNDSGGNSNILSPGVTLDVTQRNYDFKRTLQGNNFQMTGLFRNETYGITIRELGGAERSIGTSGKFPQGSVTDPLKLVLPAYGAVEVHVSQISGPVANAKVTVGGGSKSLIAYTDSTGAAVVSGIPLGSFYVQVTTLDHAFSGSASGTLSSQSTPAVVQIALAAYAGITGLVDAEAGGPSVGTRVVASFSGRVLEVMTDSNGQYTFQGIPTGSTVSLVYMGPDDVTVGARQSVGIAAGDASKVIDAPRVKLDGTAPQVASIFPADGSSNVSPDSTIRIVFTERVASNYLTTTYMQLLPADSSTPVATTFGSTANLDGTFTVTMTPPAAPPGQNFPLRSNTLYRVIVSGEVRDLTGNKLPAPRGASFITSDYAEPKVLKVIPPTSSALQPATTFEFRFNEPIDPAPWQPGGSGQFHFYKISAFGETGTIIAEKPGRAFVDPANGLSLFFAPNDPIEQESFYRVVFSGVRDLQGNVVGQQTFHFFSYDLIKPFVTLISPVPDTFPLISGVEYLLTPDIRNATAGGSVATDVAKVDYFRVDGATATYIFTATTSPWAYRFVAPDAPSGGSTLTLRAVATDLSLNEGDPGSMTWQVHPNQAPRNVTVALTPATSIYPGNHELAAVTFDDEGTQVTVQLEAQATQTDGSEYRSSQVKQITRAKVSDAWTAANFDLDLPATLKQGTRATFNATATDVRGLKGTGGAGVDLSVDAVAPQIVSLSPTPQTRYNIGQKFQIVAAVKDLETGVAEVTFAFDHQSITVTRPSSRVTPIGDHFWSFSSGDVTVPAKNVDTTIAITATAKDYNNNVISRGTEVVYVGVNDPTVPKGAWLCPIDNAVYPAAKTLPVKLQVRATDDIAVTAVKFTVPGVADPIAAARVGTTEIYEATATLTFPAPGATLALSVTISDADATHDLVLPLVLEAVAVDTEIDGFPQAVTAANADSYTNKSVLVRGTLGKLIPHLPLTLKNLIVLDGAKIETLSTTTTTERKLDLTVTDHFYLDCASSIDVSSRGYLGGWAVDDDGSGNKNNDQHGRTLGNTVSGGASTHASASHGGTGGERSTGVTNAVYGSVSDPFDLGAGGGGGVNAGFAGGSGGGAVKLTGGTFAVAGAIRADGAARLSDGNAGAGGSINIRGSQVVVGPAGRVTANGGDDDSDASASRGAGGGRIAIAASDRVEVEALGVQIQARGGRNNTTTEAPNHVDGGAGTVFIRRPGQALGELFAGSFDERATQSIHLTRPTPLTGELRFDRLTLGSRALVRADASIEVAGQVDTRSAATIDPTAVLILNGEIPTLQATTTPAAGGSLIQASALSVNYTAASAAGIGSVKLAFSPVTPDRVDTYTSYPASAAPSAVALAVPSDAAAGAATLTLSATDRAGRGVQLAQMAYSIVANTPPVIDQFDAAPLSLYPGKSVTATVSAHDDLKITKLTFTRTIGAGTPTVTTQVPNTATVTNQVFTASVPIGTPGGQTLTLETAIEDGYPGRPATRDTKLVSILKDTVAPGVTLVAPIANALFQEGTGNTIAVRATIADADVGVKEAFVQIDNGTPVAMTKSGTDYIVSLPVPPVDGTEVVTRTLTVTGKDYEGNAATASVEIKIQPLNDPNAPVISWACSTTGAMYPAGYTAKLRVYAIGNAAGNTANGIQKVEMTVDESPAPLTATAVPGLTNYYEVAFAIPADSAANRTFNVRAVATNASGLTESAATAFTVVVAGRTITSTTTIAANDTSYDNQVVVVQGGTTTIAGPHTFDKLIVLDGAIVTHAPTDSTTIQRLTFTAGAVFVSCTGSIDVSNRGFSGSTAGYGRTWQNTTTGGSYNGAGGSHGGRGGAHDANGDSATAYGSLFDPDTPGGAGGFYSNGTCNPCNAGGGIARVTAQTFVLDGKVLSNGQQASGSGAGGSIRIDAAGLTGGGEIHADGAAYWAGAGGGRIAVYYQTLGLDRARISAAGGPISNNPTRTGTAGTIYLQKVDAAKVKVADELVLDNLDRNALRATPLPVTGTGTVTAVNGAVVTLSSPVPEWIEGATIEFLDADGAVISSYEIAARTNTTVTLRMPAGDTQANVATGNAYRGVWRFDQVTAQRYGVLESGTLRTPLVTTTPTGLLRFDEIRSDDITLRGRAEVNGLLAARNLTMENGALLTHSPTTSTTINRLNVQVAQTMTVDSTSWIDVSARGLTGSSAGYGRTWPNTTAGGSYNGAGGSHGGRGGAHDNNGDSALSYGSPIDPSTPGGAGGFYSNGTCYPCNAGGGVARIAAKTLVLDGKVLSNGQLSGANGTGAGGSIRIDAGSLTGIGEIHADGAAPYWAAGGGGRVAVYYQTLGFDRTHITAAGGLYANNTRRTGAAGTIYFRRTDASGSRLADELLIDNLDRIAARATTLPAIGSGTVTAVSGAVVTLSSPVPEWIEGASIDFLDATGAVISTYEIASGTATSVTVRLASGEVAPNVAVGNGYRGAWRFDQVTAQGQGSIDSDSLITPLISTSGTGLVRFGSIRGGDITLRGRVEADSITASNLALEGGAVLMHPPTTDTTIHRLVVNVAGTLNVDAASSIDLSARGFTGSVAGRGRTWPNTTAGGSYNGAGGSHGGRGGAHDNNGDSAATYGSAFDPNTPGGAGGFYSNGTCYPCNAGGGVARIAASTFILNGKVLSSGQLSGANGTGAGGSIRIDAGSLTGTGEIHADGAAPYWAAGGGGRVAVYYQTLGVDPARITAAGGLYSSNATRTGAAGTVFLKQTSQPFGDLVIDNLGRTTNKPTPLTNVGYATVTGSGTDFVTAAASQFLAPDHLRGIRLVVNYDRSRNWPILSNDATQVGVDVSGQPLTAQNGQPLRGLYRLDTLKLRNAKLDVIDLLEVSSAIDKDASSSVVGANEAPPLLNAALISLQATATGAAIIGTAGAATDLDKPVVALATNTASANVYTATVAADGSFTLPVEGNAGDAITMKARDANAYPLESPVLAVGNLPSTTQTPSQINKTAWTTDTNFLARTLSRDGSYLAVASLPTSNGSSTQLVVLNVSDPAHPALARTVTSPYSTIRDVAVSNGWAHVAADRFFTLDLGNPAAVPIVTDDQPGAETAVLLTGGYAFTAEAAYYNDGRIHIYDVSTPSVPRYIRTQAVAGYGGISFTDLLALGTDYIVGLSNNKPFSTGRDVMVIDRRDIGNLRKVVELDIPNFDAFRGKLIGTTLYVVSLSSPQMVIVDLSDPAAPRVAGSITIPAAAGGLAVIGADAFAAAGAAGMVNVNVSNPAAPTLTGVTAVSGNAFDAAVVGPFVYVANELGLAIVPAQVSPDVTLSRITMSLSGTMVGVTGAPQSVTGNMPITIAVTNASTGTSTSGLPVQSDGSFAASISGSAGNVITIMATDSFGRVTGPLTIGTVPFGSQSQTLLIPSAMTDSGFMARNVATAGDHLVVASYPSGNSSDKLVLFDVTDRAHPLYKRTLATGAGAVRDVAVRDGWAFITADRFMTLNLNDPAATPIFTADQPGSENAMEIVGGYAFVAEDAYYNDGRLHIYDISTPSAPRYLRTQAVTGYGGISFTALTALGTDYLIGVSPNAPFGTGRDVVVIDRRDINNLKKVAELDVANFTAFRGKVIGSRLYLTGLAGGMAVVDLSNPAQPSPLGVFRTPGSPRSVDALGAILAVADGSSGATFVDISPAETPAVLGNQPVGGNAWECAFNGITLYIANEAGLAVIHGLGTPPLIDRSLITTSSDGVSTATVTGAAGSILGLAPITVEVRNATSGVSGPVVPLASDGSFATAVTGVPGDTLTLKATDSANRVSGPLTLGTVPFGSQMRSTTISATMSDGNFLARMIAADENDVVVAGSPVDTGSDKILLFDATVPGAPLYKRTVASGAGSVRGLVVRDGYAFLSADRFMSLNLGDAAAVPVFTGDQPGGESALEIVDGYAFSAENAYYNDGRIHIYDVSTPSAPRYVRTQAVTGYGGISFTGLAAMGSDYLVAVSPNAPFSTGRDVIVLDRRDVHNLKKISEYDIPSFSAYRVKVLGSMAVVTGISGGVALVDLSNPALPQPITVVAAPGAARGLDMAGATAVVANGSNGISFVDVSDPLAPRLIGAQPVAGNAWDVALSRGAMYVASELGITAVANVALPPMIKESRLTVTPAATTTAVAGGARAITGIVPLAARVDNTATSESSPNVAVAADGSFSTAVAAVPGHPLRITATDAAGRASTRGVGTTYGATSTRLANQLVANDPNYRARRVASDGNATITSTGSVTGTTLPTSNKLLLFRQPDASEPPQIITFGGGPVFDIDVSLDHAFVVGDRFGTINLSNPALPTIFASGDQPGGESALTLSGQYAFTAENSYYNDGRIHIYNVSNPDAPAYVRTQAVAGYGGISYRALVAMGTSYLVALSPDKPFSSGHDLTVIDITNINSLQKVFELDIPNFDALDAVLDGTTLYVAGGDAGVAIVDMINPRTPQLVKVIDTPGIARGLAISGPNELAVADAGGPGVTFIDVADKTRPVIIGSQKVIGNVVDVDVIARNIYVAAENYFHVILRP